MRRWGQQKNLVAKTRFEVVSLVSLKATVNWKHLKNNTACFFKYVTWEKDDKCYVKINIIEKFR